MRSRDSLVRRVRVAPLRQERAPLDHHGPSICCWVLPIEEGMRLLSRSSGTVGRRGPPEGSPILPSCSTGAPLQGTGVSTRLLAEVLELGLRGLPRRRGEPMVGSGLDGAKQAAGRPAADVACRGLSRPLDRPGRMTSTLPLHPGGCSHDPPCDGPRGFRDLACSCTGEPGRRHGVLVVRRSACARRDSRTGYRAAGRRIAWSLTRRWKARGCTRREVCEGTDIVGEVPRAWCRG